ncbi:MAG TPA: XrtA/PEP-CTERM system exopolysaccharide export protein [Casimicrobiaceae bacterium]|nr:XrtA/PEP-CTERM system exopolysaccharide export protein [Casimicrobiaceae bacterium]
MVASISRIVAGSLVRAGVLGAVMLTVLLGACSTTKHPPAPQQARTSDYSYKIGPLDNVNVIVWRNPELSIAVPVRPDGKISTPLVDDIVAIGKTPTELEREIEKTLTKFIRDPVVTVVVSSFAGPVSEQIRVTGEAAKPQVLSFRQDMTLLDVMIAVGGLTDFADGNAATIYRAAEGGKMYSVRLRDLVKRGDISANVDMRPGDILIIPQSWF